jgi:hypothetical protein
MENGDKISPSVMFRDKNAVFGYVSDTVTYKDN